MADNSTAISRGVVVAALLLCAAFGVATAMFARNAEQLRVQLTETEARLAALQQAQPAAAPARRDNDDAALLRRMLQERDAAYAELRDAYEELRRHSDEPDMDSPAFAMLQSSAQPAGPGRGSGNEGSMSWLERMRIEDPERYRQVQEAREQRRREFEARFHEQYAGIDQRLRTARSRDEAELLNQMAATLAQAEELRRAWEELRNLTGEQRREAAQQLAAQSRETHAALSDLRARDRELQLRQLAAHLGYRDPREIAQFVETIDRIHRETDPALNRLLGIQGAPRGGRAGGSGRSE
jgi:hypothetical protein